MRVLSLFDGISCLRVALGNKCSEYLASEIDKNAIKVSKSNYPDIQHIGNVKDVKDIKNIDLLCGGSPCQDLSIAKKDRKGLEGDKSGLFWEYVRIWKETKPKWFILENVASMPKKDKDIITKELGVDPIMIDASLVSAQSRKRLFWTNIPVKELPKDKGIILKDILEPDGEVDERMTLKNGKAFCLTANYHNAIEKNSVEKKQRTMVKIKKENKFFNQIGYYGSKNCGFGGQALRVYDTDKKATTSGVGFYKIGRDIRKLTPIECERLQGLPDNYTQGIAMTNRYKVLGNAFNVDVLKHILSFID